MMTLTNNTACAAMLRLVTATLVAVAAFSAPAAETTAPKTALKAKAPADAADVRVLTCNIRVALTSDTLTGHGWEQRRDACVQVIHKQKADIICLQEVLREQINDLQKAMPEYAVFGFAGPEMDYEGKEYRLIAKNPIMYNRERFTLLVGGNYWLSETPLIGGSISWGSARARNLSWVRLKDNKTGHEFRVMNTHLDHITQQARMKQIELVLKESGQYAADFPQILTGDFNANVRNDVIKTVLSSGWTDTWQAIHGDKDAGFTVHGFLGPAYKPKKVRPYMKIDFVFVRGAVTPVETHIIRDEVNGVYPSDHYFVSADVKL